MQPNSQNNPNIHKGPSSSAEFNKLRNEIHHDLVQLFNLANTHNAEIKENMDIVIRENFFLQTKIAELEDTINAISQDLLYREEGVDKQRLIKSFFSSEGLADGDINKEAYVNTVYGYLTVPPSDTISKIAYKSADGTVVIPESLEVTVYESTNTQSIDPQTGNYTYYQVEDENLYKAFDRNKNTVWARTTTFPKDAGVSEVYGILHIKLPLDVLNDVYSNHLVINPSPEYSLCIDDIQIKGYGEQWYRLDNYPTEKTSLGEVIPKELHNSGKLTFSFPKTEVTEIQIMFTQPYWFDNEDNREFVYGFQEINLEHRVVNGSEAEIVSEFSLEGTNKRFSIIDEPTIVPLVGASQEIEDLVEHKLYYNQDLTNEFGFGTEIMSPVQKVYVKTIVRSQGEVIPMIRQLNLDYTFKHINEF